CCPAVEPDCDYSQAGGPSQTGNELAGEVGQQKLTAISQLSAQAHQQQPTASQQCNLPKNQSSDKQPRPILHQAAGSHRRPVWGRSGFPAKESSWQLLGLDGTESLADCKRSGTAACDPSIAATHGSHDLPASASRASVGGSRSPAKVISEPALVAVRPPHGARDRCGFHLGCEGCDGLLGSGLPHGPVERGRDCKLIRIYEGPRGHHHRGGLSSPVDLHLHRAHSGAVTCAAFAGPERIVSGGSDRMLRLWDMRKLSTALTTIRLDAAVNRLAVHPYYPSIAALPLDNRHVQLCHLGGSGGGARRRRRHRHLHRVNVSAGGSGGSGSGGGVGNLLAPAGVGASIGGGGGGGQSSAANVGVAGAVAAAANAPASAGAASAVAAAAATGVSAGGVGDLGGGRLLGRLPRQDGKCGHLRLASAACWGEDSHRFNLFTAGFDCQILAWKVGDAGVSAPGWPGRWGRHWRRRRRRRVVVVVVEAASGPGRQDPWRWQISLLDSFAFDSSLLGFLCCRLLFLLLLLAAGRPSLPSLPRPDSGFNLVRAQNTSQICASHLIVRQFRLGVDLIQLTEGRLRPDHKSA
uniref:WD_REPEATS_REGION domain-containing protein n=1 Tax=Macrostomum lignano TaxID=282301 RepID=A0A1I8JPA1_9PLAT